MTPAERADVAILNGSRRARIARGAGVEVRDVNELVNRFIEARKMMQSMGQAMGGGLPGLPGGRRPAKQQQAKRGKGGKKISGNPAKRAAQLAEQNRPKPQSTLAGGQPSAAEMQAAMADFQLPSDVQQMLNQQNKGPR